MRARNLKPGLFKNETLGCADPLYTVIFEGLWCLADREGRLEDRPRRIHAEINPYRDFEGTERALNWLVDNSFLARYQYGAEHYLEVCNFRAHQQPHIREAPSKIPSNHKVALSTVPAPCQTGESMERARLIPSSLTPDSPLLIPDSGFPLPATRQSPRARPRANPTGPGTLDEKSEEVRRKREAAAALAKASGGQS